MKKETCQVCQGLLYYVTEGGYALPCHACKKQALSMGFPMGRVILFAVGVACTTGWLVLGKRWPYAAWLWWVQLFSFAMVAVGGLVKAKEYHDRTLRNIVHVATTSILSCAVYNLHAGKLHPLTKDASHQQEPDGGHEESC